MAIRHEIDKNLVVSKGVNSLVTILTLFEL